MKKKAERTFGRCLVGRGNLASREVQKRSASFVRRSLAALGRQSRRYPLLLVLLVLLIYTQFYLAYGRLLSVCTPLLLLPYVQIFCCFRGRRRGFLLALVFLVELLPLGHLCLSLDQAARYESERASRGALPYQYRILTLPQRSGDGQWLSFLAADAERPLLRFSCLLRCESAKRRPHAFRTRGEETARERGGEGAAPFTDETEVSPAEASAPERKEKKPETTDVAGNDEPPSSREAELEQDEEQLLPGLIFSSSCAGERIRDEISPHAASRSRFAASELCYYSLILTKQDIKTEADSPPDFALKTTWLLRRELERLLRPCLGPEARSLARACLLADRSQWPKRLNRDFRAAALMHILAASGTHLQFYLLWLSLLLKKTRLRFVPRQCFLLFLAFLFVTISAGAPALLRAFSFLALQGAARLRKRPLDSLSACCHSSVFLLLFQPALLFKTAYVLSFLASMALIAAGRMYAAFYFEEEEGAAAEARILARLLCAFSRADLLWRVPAFWQIWHRGRRRLLRLFLVYLLIQMALAPFLLPMGGRISVWAFVYHFFAQLLLCFFLFTVLPLCVFAALLPPGFLLRMLSFWPELAARALFALSASARASLMRSFLLPAPRYFGVVYAAFFLLLISLFYFRRQRRRARDAAENEMNPFPEECESYTKRKGKFVSERRRGFILAGLFVLWIAWTGQGMYTVPFLCEVRFLSGGTGDLAVIELFDGRRILIDAAKEEDAPKYLGTYLERQSRPEVDLLVISHLHEDHYGGGLYLADEGLLRAVYWRRSLDGPRMDEQERRESRKAYEKMKEKWVHCGAEIHGAEETPLIEISPDIRLRLLDSAPEEAKDENGRSLVQMLEIGERRILFTGDLSAEDEERVLRCCGETIRADVLKVSHHGSKYSSGSRFLRAVGAKMAVITVGKNRYGHPAEETVGRLRSAGAEVYRSDLDGDLLFRFETDGRVRFHCIKKESCGDYLENYRSEVAFLDTIRHDTIRVKNKVIEVRPRLLREERGDGISAVRCYEDSSSQTAG